MTIGERRRRICEKLARRIGEVTPDGLGRWDEAWERVREPSDRFLDALTAYLEEDAPETRARVQRAADDLVRAWRSAGEAWKAQGPPGSRTRQEVAVTSSRRSFTPSPPTHNSPRRPEP